MGVSRYMFWALTCSLGFAILATLVLGLSMPTDAAERFVAIMCGCSTVIWRRRRSL